MSCFLDTFGDIMYYMNIGKRSLHQFLKALVARQHYIAFFNIIKNFPDFVDVFIRYFFGVGSYPYSIKIKTPTGTINPLLHSYYDILTVNEIFCRLDYKTDNKPKIVVDFGSNIGISALYFLTRSPNSKCYLFEPVSENIKKLKENLSQFSDKYTLEEVAVSNENGVKRFGTEEHGRCGGLLRETGNYINVKCVKVNDILQDILNKEKIIDILKIDTEGNELDIINSIEKRLLPKIKTIFFEIDHTIKFENNIKILADYYEQIRYGNTVKLILRDTF